jgi:hypothetical protein
MSESYCLARNGELVAYVGPDAVELARAITLRSAIKMHKACGMKPMRGLTITKQFILAGKFTGQTYRRGQHDRAIEDLTVWIETMRSAMPVRHEP